MTETQGIDTSAIDPTEFARAVADTPREQLEEAMASEGRRFVLDGIFERMAEHYDGPADGADELDAVFHWKILDRPDGGYDHYETVVRDGACTVSTPPEHEPSVTLRVGPVDFLCLVTGNASGPALFLRRRLKIEGDIALAARLPNLFRIPRS